MAGQFTKNRYRRGHPKAEMGYRFFMLPEDVWTDPSGRPSGCAVRVDRVHELVERLLLDARSRRHRRNAAFRHAHQVTDR